MLSAPTVHLYAAPSASSGEPRKRRAPGFPAKLGAFLLSFLRNSIRLGSDKEWFLNPSS
jgi:hypothetical protein